LGNGKQFPVPSDASILIAPQLALAAIAAPLAFFAAMIGASVFGAVHADLGRRLAADAAREGDGFVH